MAICTNHDPPSAVLLLRHAEKPDDNNDINLSTRGYSRAGALPSWLIKQFGTPYAIYAMDPSDKSHLTLRPIQTVTPLSETIGVAIDKSYRYGQIHKLVHSVLTNVQNSGRLIVICWEHDEIKDIAKLFGYDAKPWKSDDFDHLWLLDSLSNLDNKNNKPKIIPQKLLYGDSS